MSDHIIPFASLEASVDYDNKRLRRRLLACLGNCSNVRSCEFEVLLVVELSQCFELTGKYELSAMILCHVGEPLI